MTFLNLSSLVLSPAVFLQLQAANARFDARSMVNNVTATVFGL